MVEPLHSSVSPPAAHVLFPLPTPAPFRRFAAHFAVYLYVAEASPRRDVIAAYAAVDCHARRLRVFHGAFVRLHAVVFQRDTLRFIFAAATSHAMMRER